MSIIVFAGPTITHHDAKQWLPNALYLPPARSGDILRAMRLSPTHIALIDGYFEHTNAVLHKEILYALEQGIQVYGASSLGALRAAELSEFGMIGVGAIATAYANGLTDDAAVTVLHHSEQANYSMQTVPLVTILATLQLLIAQHIIKPSTANIIEQAAAALFYQERTRQNLTTTAYKLNIDQLELKTVNDWIDKHGFYDIKRHDAITLLKQLANRSNTVTNKTTAVNVNRSIFFRTHYKYVMCRPWNNYIPELPLAEKIALKAAEYTEIHRYTIRLAYLLSASFALAMHEQSLTNHADYLGQDATRIAKRFSQVEALLNNTTQITQQTPHDYLLYLMKLAKHNEYQHYKNSSIDDFAANEPIKYRTFFWISRLWWLIEQFAAKRDLHLNPDKLHEFNHSFRTKRGLSSLSDMQEWLAINDFTQSDYCEFLQASMRLHHIVLQNNLDVLGFIDNYEGIWWFQDALHLSTLYASARQAFETTTLNN